MPLLEVWRATPAAVLDMTIEQILRMAGDGKLKDGSECATELREFLTKIDRPTLKTYADHCLNPGFQDSGFVLQDIVNEVGRRFGLDVTHGLFCGLKNQNNADGVWRGPGWTFIIEVKTTDAYAINLDTIADCQTAYMVNAAGRSHEARSSSCLLVVGRQDTATLEDQLRSSRHNWQMRIVGVDALFAALELKEMSEDTGLGEKLLDLLKPREFTRVDEILSAVFDFAKDREQAVEAAIEKTDNILTFTSPPAPLSLARDPVTEADQTLRPYVSDRRLNAEIRAAIVRRIEQKFTTKLTGDQVCLRSQTDDTRFAILISKAYDAKSKYWYGFSPRQRKFLAGTETSYLVLCCSDTRRAFLVPAKVMNSLIPHMNTTPPEGGTPKFHHVRVGQDGNRLFIHTRSNSQLHDITPYEL